MSQLTSPVPRRFQWWHALGILALAYAICAVPALLQGDLSFVSRFREPSVAPPTWLFAPAWLFINICAVTALYRVANDPRQTALHRRFYALETASWVLFAAFNTFYFGLKSPVLAAADTAALLVVTVFSLATAVRLDRRAALLLLPRLLWLLLASYVAIWIALNNPDVFLGLG